ncbi:type II toxin-antitoxin system RelB/DinJ family antitoxin [Bifidobacterium faecale]|nr:type II toxin-antitoxin system RelB/DinJ family antitoxin [Bifidobacterium faecale]
MVVQLATRVDDDQAEEFRETTKKLGLSTADALRMFVSSFNEYQGFPYQVRVRQVVPEKLRTLDHGRPWSDDQFASTRLSSNRDMSR